jgi:hypothetical protein
VVFAPSQSPTRRKNGRASGGKQMRRPQPANFSLA